MNELSQIPVLCTRCGSYGASIIPLHPQEGPQSQGLPVRCTTCNGRGALDRMKFSMKIARYGHFSQVSAPFSRFLITQELHTGEAMVRVLGVDEWGRHVSGRIATKTLAFLESVALVEEGMWW